MKESKHGKVVSKKTRPKKQSSVGMKQRVSQIGQGFKSMDMFGEGVALNISGETKFQTCFGALLTLLIFGLSLTYAGYKFFSLVYKEDTSIVIFE